MKAVCKHTETSLCPCFSYADSMHILGRATRIIAPGILTTLPKPAKGMREQLVAWKKKDQHLLVIIPVTRHSRSNFHIQHFHTQQVILNISDQIKTVTQEDFGNL